MLSLSNANLPSLTEFLFPSHSPYVQALEQDDDSVSGMSRSVCSEHFLSIAWRKCTYWWSTALLLFALVVHVYGIAMGWNNAPWRPAKAHPVVEIAFMFFMMTWVALLEGCQISIVGLQGVNMELYKHSHPRA